MADDSSYADFLNQANRHVSTGATGGQATRMAPPEAKYYLSSETDEPWLDFRQSGARAKTAQDFAKLVSEHGEAEFVTMAEDVQYEEIVQLVGGRAQGEASHGNVELVHIKQGTRISVFVVRYDDELHSYIGLRSMKVES